MNQIIHFVVSSNDEATQAVEAARRWNPSWEIRVWDNATGVQGSRLAKWYDRAPTEVGRSNLIRLDAVYLMGGVYLDADLILQKPLDRLMADGHFFCSKDGQFVTNSVFGAETGNAHVAALIDGLTEREPDWSTSPDVTTGPRYFARVLRWRSDVTLVPRDTFFPLDRNASLGNPPPTTYGLKPSIDSGRRKSWGQNLSPRTHRWDSRRAGLSFKPFRRDRSTLPMQPAKYLAGDTLIVSTRENVVMALPAEDLSVVPSIAFDGTYEPQELAFIRSVLEPGDFMVDVGCNVGLHTLVAAREVGPFGRVFSFDPNQRLLDHVAMSLRLNWMHERVTTYGLAIGDRSGSARFSFPKRNFGEGSIRTEEQSAHARLRDALGSSEDIEVPMERLDHLFPHGIEIKVLKVDAEGHDHAVLAGASGLFRERCIAHLLVEAFEDIAPLRFRLLVEELVGIQACGYEVRSLGTDGAISQPFEAEELRAGPGRADRNLIVSRL